MKLKIFILILISIFLVSFFVQADEEGYQYGLGVEALGFQSNQAYFGAGTGASVNAFSGNLVLSSTDASIPGANGLGASFTRYYNGNVHVNTDDSFPGPENLLKSSWLGYGWNSHLGKIIVLFWETNDIEFVEPDEFYKDLHFYVENGDGSRLLMSNNNGLDDYEWGDSDGFYTDVLYSEYQQDNLKKYVFLVPEDESKIIWYHVVHPTDTAERHTGYCLKNAGDVFVRVLPDKTRMYYSHWVEYNGDYSDYMDGMYCETDSDCVEGYYCDETNNECLLNGYDDSYRQFNYPGVYLTKIIDPDGNEVNINYYSDSPQGNPIEECSLDGAPSLVKYSRSWGSPFIQKIETSVGEINFNVENYEDINGKLDYLTYKNHEGKDIMIDYIYSGDDGVENEYDDECQTGGSCCRDEFGILHPNCDDGSLLVRVEIKDFDSGQLLYPAVRYEYYREKNDPGSFFALKKIISPFGAETNYNYEYLHHSAGGLNGAWLKKIKSYTIKENPNDLGLTYEYSYDQKVSGTLKDFTIHNPSDDVLSTRTTTVKGPLYENGDPIDENGEYVKTVTKYFDMNPAGMLYWDDFVSGKPILNEIYSCIGENCDLKKQTKTSYGQWVGKGNTKYLSDSLYDTKPTAVIHPQGTITLLREKVDGYWQEKTYAQKVFYGDYENPIRTINYGEIDSASWDENGFISFVVDDNNQPDDAVLVETNYYYETLDGQANGFEGQNDIYDYLIRLPSETITKSCLVNIDGQCVEDEILSNSVFDEYDNKGHLLSTSVWDNTDGENWLTSYLGYDDYGNVNEFTNPAGKKYYTSYWNGVALREEWVYPDDTTRLSKQYYYYPANYQLRKQVDENGNVYEYKYDSLGRLEEVYLPGDGDDPSSWIYYNDPTGDPYAEVYAEVHTKDDGDDYFNSIKNYYDNLGRNFRTEQEDPQDPSKIIVVDTLYNEESLVKEVSKPYHIDKPRFFDKVEGFFGGLFGDEGQKTIEIPSEVLTTKYLEYDALNRLKEIQPAGSLDTVTTEYGVDWSRVYDEKGSKVTSYTDAYGRTIKVVDNANAETNFVYDKLGNLVSTKDAKLHESTNVYNSLGQLKESHHPDAGDLNVTYDESGNIETSDDGINMITYEYDDINRLTKVKVNGNVLKEYYYDHCAKGMLCSVISFADEYENGYTTLSYEYDELGNVVKLMETIEDKNYVTDYEYYDGGNLKKIIYPDGNEVIYEYDDIGRLELVGIDENNNNQIDDGEEIEEILSYNVEGTVDSLKYGNDIITEYGYTDRDWLESIKVGSDVFSASYSYDQVGNILGEFSDSIKENKIAEYTYDDVYRLIDVSDHGKYGFGLSYSYDAVGNRLTKTVNGEVTEYNNWPVGGNLLFGTNNQLTSDDLFTYVYSITGNMEGKQGREINIGFDSTGVWDSGNLLSDGGFESGNLGNWETGNGEQEITDETSYEGVYSFKQTVDESAWTFQNILVEAGEQYILSGWIKTENWNTNPNSPGANLIVECYAGPDCSGETYPCFVPDPINCDEDCDNGIKNEAWTYIEKEITATSDKCIKILLYGGACGSSENCDPASGIMYVDDLKFEKVGGGGINPTGDYAIWDLEDVSVGDPVTILYDYTEDMGSTGCEGAVWETFVQYYPEPNIYGRNNVVFINNDNLVEGSSSSCPLDWYNINHLDTAFTINPSDIDYVYDYANRLIRINDANGDCREAYLYNPNGLRVLKISPEEELKTYYIYDASGNVIMEETEHYTGTNCEFESKPDFVCGNRLIEDGEVCDYYVQKSDGFSITEDCSDFPYPVEFGCSGNYLGGKISCSSDCESKDFSNCNNPTDTIKEDGEECVLGDILSCADIGCISSVFGENPDLAVYRGCVCSLWDVENTYDENCDCTQSIDCFNTGGKCFSIKEGEVVDEYCECVSGQCDVPGGPYEGDIYNCGTGFPGFLGDYKVKENCDDTHRCLIPLNIPGKEKPSSAVSDPSNDGESPWEPLN